MSLQTPNPDIPDQGRLIAKIHGDLSAFCAQHGGSVFMTESTMESFYYLANGAGQFVLTIHLGGDRAEFGGGPRISDPVLDASIVVRILHNEGFDHNRAAGKNIDLPGSRSLLWVVSEVRRRVLSYRITPEVISQGELYYQSMRPLALPDGQPLTGYELTFTCFMNMSLSTSQDWKPIDL